MFKKFLRFIITGACLGSLATPALALELGFSDQTLVELTIYDDFAVVRDVREGVLPIGLLDIDFQGVAQTIDPGTVRVVSRTRPDGFAVLEQAYEYDLLNKQSLLERYIGKKLKYSRSILQGSSYEKILREGILLSINPEIVKFGDEIEVSPEGVISLPYVPEGLKAIPTLSWRADNRTTGSQLIETTYIADGLGWQTDYRLTLAADEKTMDLVAWVNLRNRSGIDYRNAGVKVVAGDVKRVRTQPQPMMDMARRESAMMSAPSPEARSLSDYHVFDLPSRISLPSNQTRQVQLMKKTGVKVSKSYVASAAVPNHRMPQVMSERFDVVRSFLNTRQNGMGVPLPRGRAGVFVNDRDGALELVGEDLIKDTPTGEVVRIVTGKAFDLVIERTQTQWGRISDNTNEVSYDVQVRNNMGEAVSVIVEEKFYGDWTILSQTADGRKINSTTQEYVLALKAGESRSFTYSVRMTY